MPAQRGSGQDLWSHLVPCKILQWIDEEAVD
jgi:hypothetical protein